MFTRIKEAYNILSGKAVSAKDSKLVQLERELSELKTTLIKNRIISGNIRRVLSHSTGSTCYTTDSYHAISLEKLLDFLEIVHRVEREKTVEEREYFVKKQDGRRSGYLSLNEAMSKVQQSVGTSNAGTNYTYTWFTPSSSAEGKAKSKKTRKANVEKKGRKSGRLGGKKRKSS